MSTAKITHASLAEALVAFGSEAPTLSKDAVNPHFRSKFASLDTIVETVRPLLAKHGLAWTATPGYGPDGSPALAYRLIHVSGDELAGVMPLLLSKNDPQGQGSAITYARRYSISAVLNLVADEDDDGNGATPRNGHAAAPAVQTATAEDVEELRAAATGLTAQQVKLVIASLGIAANGWGQIPRAKVAALAEKLASTAREGVAS